MEQIRRIKALVALLAILGLCNSVHAQLRVVSWNTAGGPREGLGDILEAIGNEEVNGIAKPIDILSLQEQSSTATTTQQIVDELNAIYGAGTYARGSVDGDSSGAGRPGFIYNTQTVSGGSLTETTIGVVDANGQARQTMRYSFRLRDYPAQLTLYSSHLKASTGSSNEARRLVEAQAIRDDADALGDANIIYTGDYNIRSSFESSYQEILSPGNGQAFDPINAPGSWHENATFKQWHTQAPATNPPGGLVGGGVDDRFDFQLVTGELMDGEGYSYIPGSYRVFGNDGMHDLSGDISSGTGASADILAKLESVSDHLPVVADYQMPARIGAGFAFIPNRIVLGSEFGVDFSLTNTAEVVASIGADELDYVVTGTGGILGSFSGTAEALAGSNQHTLMLDTSSIKTYLAGYTLDTSGSPEAASNYLHISTDYQVVAPTGDFDDDGFQSGNDFLIWQRGKGVGTWLRDGDADGSRVIDGDDLALWRSEYGVVSPLVVVPEPSTSLICCLALLCSARRVR